MTKRRRQDTLTGRNAANKAVRQATASGSSTTMFASEPITRRGRLFNIVRGAFTENLGFKLLALILAATLFLLVNTDRDREITARVGVAYTLPDGKVLVSSRINEIRITVRGPWRRLRHFDEREIDRVSLDLSTAAAAAAGQVAITRDMLTVPPGLEITSWEPRSIPVAFEALVEKTVEVNPIVVGRPLHGYVVSEVTATPHEVTVRGAAGDIADLGSVRTIEIRVDGRSSPLQAVVQLSAPDNIEVQPSDPVRVDIAFEEVLVTRQIGPLPVVVETPADSADGVFVTAPVEVKIVLTGSMRAVEAAVATVGKTVRPTVRIPASDATKPPKTQTATVFLKGLAPGLGVEIVPPQVQVSPQK